MAFDFRSFFTSRHIPFVTSGPNVSRGEVGIKCPFCRDDPSEHMAVSLDGRGWSCRRNRQHSGKSAARLINALLQCGMEQANAIVGTRRHLQADVASTVANLLQPKGGADVSDHRLRLPSEFKPFRRQPKFLERPFADYLKSRGFSRPDYLTEDYDLYYALRGPFAYRIIFPIYFEGRLVNWTARAIGNDSLRYKTLSTNKEKALPGDILGIGPISDYLLWYDDLMDIECDTIMLMEGPFDALKVNELGRDQGICATCFFTTVPSRQQIELLHSLLPRFKRRYLLQDRGVEARALETNAALSALKLRPAQLPPGVDDPGELTPATWRKISLD